MFLVKAMGIIQTGDAARIFEQFYRPIQNDPFLSSSDNQRSVEKSIALAALSISPGITDVLLIDSSNTALYQRLPSSSTESLIAFVLFSNEDNANELLFSALLDSLLDGLKFILCANSSGSFSFSKQSILDNYDAVSILFDELVDDGIILELDSSSLLSRLPRRQTQLSPSSPDASFSEQSISQALNTAKYWKEQLLQRATHT